MDHRRHKRERMLSRGAERGARFLYKGRRVSLAMSRVRMGLALAGMLVCAMLYKLGWFVTGNWTLVGFLLGFLSMVHVHGRLESRLRRLATWIEIQESNLARLRVDWDGIPESTITLSPEHPYATDLDLFGQHSLLRYWTRRSHGTGRCRWLLG